MKKILSLFLLLILTTQLCIGGKTELSNIAITGVTAINIFSPLDISGLQIWLDANDGSTFTFNGPDISEWLDKSGNGNNATQTVQSSQPSLGILFNVPGVDIAASGEVLDLPFTYDWTNLPFTVLAVATKRSSTGFRGIIGDRFGAGAAFWWTLGQFDVDGAEIVVERGNSAFAPRVQYGIFAQGLPPQIYELNHNGVDAGFANGVLADSQSKVLIGGVTNALKIGRWVGVSQGWDGLIHEIIIYNKAIDQEERDELVIYLTNKWINQ